MIGRSQRVIGMGFLVGALAGALGCGNMGGSGTGGEGAGNTTGQGGEGASTASTGTGAGGSNTGGSSTGGSNTGGVGGAMSACAGLPSFNEPPEQLHVAPDGDDSADGSEGAPLASFAEAASRFPTGGTIVVHGGTYGPQHLDAIGAPDHPLVIRAAAGEKPILDGSSLVDEWDSILNLWTAQHVVIAGLEIAHCTAPNCRGIDANPVTDLTIQSCTIHDVQDNAASFTGNGIHLIGNKIHDVALVNVDNIKYPNGGWPGCMGTHPDRDKPDAPQAEDVVIVGNEIRDCWGEGIGVWYANNVHVEGNVVVNPFNVALYMDNTTNATITRNFAEVHRGINGGHGTGILMGSEPYDQWGLATFPSQSITITNNLVVGGSGIGWWSSSSGSDQNRYEGVHVLHNTVIATTGDAISIDDPNANVAAPSGCEAVNNVLAFADGAYVGTPDAWTFAGNAWLNDKPAVAGSTDVLVSATVPVVTKAEDLHPLASVAGEGQSNTGVLVDYACVDRDMAAPTRGAYEP